MHYAFAKFTSNTILSQFNTLIAAVPVSKTLTKRPQYTRLAKDTVAMYATNNGTTNKAPNNNSTTMFDNTITVTPIKMELTDTSVKGNVGGAAGQRRPNAVIVSSQQLAMPMQTGIQVSNSVSGNNYTGITVTSMTTTGPTPKEKPSKAARVQVTRKPPPTIENFWPTIISEVNNIGQVDAKHQVLPLARIKKIMKLDENAKMIAGEAPLLFAKACEYFIQELTMRAWVHTEESRRRTLQRSDIAQAIANYDQFDFLIDIVPREEIKPSTTQKSKEPNSSNCIGTTTASVVTAVTTVPHCNNVSGNFVTGNVISTGSLPAQATTSLKLDASAAEVLGFSAVNPELFAAAAVNSSQQLQQLTTHQQHQPQQVQIIQPGAGPQQLQYFIALPGQQPTQLVQQLQHHQQQQQQQQQNSLGLNIVTQQPTQQLILTAGPNGQLTATPAPTTAAQQQQQQTQVLLQNLAQQQQHQQQQQQQQQIQLLQQVVTPTGELTNVPIAINANQLHLLRLQMQQQQQQQQLQAAAAAQHNQQQQVIIPTQLLTAQQILQLGGTTAHQQLQQQQQQHHHQQQQQVQVQVQQVQQVQQHQQQQQQQQQHMQITASNVNSVNSNNSNSNNNSASIFINATASNAQTATQQAQPQTLQTISTDRTLSGGFR